MDEQQFIELIKGNAPGISSYLSDEQIYKGYSPQYPNLNLPPYEQSSFAPSLIPQAPRAQVSDEGNEFTGIFGLGGQKALPKAIQAALTNSLTGMAHELTYGEKPYDLSEWNDDHGTIEGLASEILGFFMPLDLLANALGGGVGSKIATAGLKSKGTKALSRILYKDGKNKLTKIQTDAIAKKVVAHEMAQKGFAKEGIEWAGEEVLKAPGTMFDLKQRALSGSLGFASYSASLNAAQQQLEKGEIDPHELALEAMHGAGTGALIGVGGGLAKLGRASENALVRLASTKPVEISLEAAALNIPQMMDGTMTKEDWLHTVAVVSGLKGVNKLAKSVSGVWKNRDRELAESKISLDAKTENFLKVLEESKEGATPETKRKIDDLIAEEKTSNNKRKAELKAELAENLPKEYIEIIDKLAEQYDTNWTMDTKDIPALIDAAKKTRDYLEKKYEGDRTNAPKSVQDQWNVVNSFLETARETGIKFGNKGAKPEGTVQYKAKIKDILDKLENAKDHELLAEFKERFPKEEVPTMIGIGYENIILNRNKVIEKLFDIKKEEVQVPEAPTSKKGEYDFASKELIEELNKFDYEGTKKKISDKAEAKDATEFDKSNNKLVKTLDNTKHLQQQDKNMILLALDNLKTGQSEKTIATYIRAMNDYARYLQTFRGKKGLFEANISDYQSYLEWGKANLGKEVKGIKVPASFDGAHITSVYKRFLPENLTKPQKGWTFEGYKFKPAKGVSGKKPQTFATNEQLKKLTATLSDKKSGYKDDSTINIEKTTKGVTKVTKKKYTGLVAKVIHNIGSRFGLRSTEMSDIRWSDIDFNKGTIKLYSDKRKGAKRLPREKLNEAQRQDLNERIIALPESTETLLRRLKAQQQSKGKKPSGSIFKQSNNKDSSLSTLTSDINFLIKKIAKDMNLKYENPDKGNFTGGSYRRSIISTVAEYFGKDSSEYQLIYEAITAHESQTAEGAYNMQLKGTSKAWKNVQDLLDGKDPLNKLTTTTSGTGGKTTTQAKTTTQGNTEVEIKESIDSIDFDKIKKFKTVDTGSIILSTQGEWIYNLIHKDNSLTSLQKSTLLKDVVKDINSKLKNTDIEVEYLGLDSYFNSETMQSSELFLLGQKVDVLGFLFTDKSLDGEVIQKARVGTAGGKTTTQAQGSTVVGKPGTTGTKAQFVSEQQQTGQGGVQVGKIETLKTIQKETLYNDKLGIDWDADVSESQLSALRNSLKSKNIVTPQERGKVSSAIREAHSLRLKFDITDDVHRSILSDMGLVDANNKPTLKGATKVSDVLDYVDRIEAYRKNKQAPNQMAIHDFIAESNNMKGFEGRDYIYKTMMPVREVLRVYGGKFGKTLAEKMDAHMLYEMNYFGKGDIALHNIIKIIGKDKIDLFYMKDNHLKGYGDTSTAAQKFYKSAQYENANKVLKQYTDYMWNEAKKTARKNMNDAEYEAFEKRFNKKYIEDYFTRSLTKEAKELVINNQNVKDKILTQILEDVVEQKTNSMKMRIEKIDKLIEKETNKFERNKLSNQRSEIQNELTSLAEDIRSSEKWRNEALGLLDSQLSYSPIKITSKHLELTRGINLPLYLMDGKGKKVKTYETDFNKTLGKYIRSQSKFLATAKALPEFTDFSGQHTFNSRINARKWLTTKDKQSQFLEYSRRALREQIMPEVDILNNPIEGHMRTLTAISATGGLSSQMSGIKNLILGSVMDYSTYGGTAFIKGWMGLFDRGNWARIREIGGLEMSTKHLEQAGVHKLVQQWSLMTPTEYANRVRAMVAGRFVAEDAIRTIRGEKNLFFLKGMRENDAISKLQRTFKLNDNEIMFLRKHGLEPTNISTKEVGYENLIDKQRFINLKVDNNAHGSTQGLTNVPNMPLWTQNKMAKPLLLFYRMAYAASTNAYYNVLKPMAYGNLLPLARYGAATGLAGAALWEIYDKILGMQKPDKEKLEEYIGNGIRAEFLGIGTNFLNPQSEGMFGGFEPVLYRNAVMVFQDLAAMWQGKKTVSQGADDIVKNSLVAYNHSKRAYNNFTNKYISNYQRVKTLEKEWLKEKGKETQGYRNQMNLISRSPFYRDIRQSFLREDLTKAAERYWAAYHYVVDDEYANGAYSDVEDPHMRELYARKEATKALKSTVNSYRPMRFSDKGKGARYRKQFEKRYKGNAELWNMITSTEQKYRTLERLFWDEVYRLDAERRYSTQFTKRGQYQKLN